ncbi:hypothetical protein PWT90_09913 [Aphanocladium album]|nr:hypothetical protein PWT90_09913 [Aphanocladium album]
MAPTQEELLYKALSHLPRPRYPFSNRVSQHIDNLALEYYQWIDADCDFRSRSARSAYKRHRLSDIAARAFPSLTLEELRPVARFTSSLAILDDFLDKADLGELEQVCHRTTTLLRGLDENRPDYAGFFRQVYLVRQDALACGMPLHLYEHFVDAIAGLLMGYGAEKQHNAVDTAPSLNAYIKLRRQTSGGLCYAKYLCMQKNYRLLPDNVLQHSTILRMHELASLLIGYHNDFISLPKELARGGDVVNLVMVVQREFELGTLPQAWGRALAIHNDTLREFTRLQENLPDFGPWHQTATEYARDLGVMVQGVYAWHTNKTGRYVPGAHQEYEKREWSTQPGLTEGESYSFEKPLNPAYEKLPPSHLSIVDFTSCMSCMSFASMQSPGGSEVSQRDDADVADTFDFDVTRIFGNNNIIEPEVRDFERRMLYPCLFCSCLVLALIILLPVGSKAWSLSDTASLSESAQTFPEEFGRTYHAYHAGSYPFPNDVAEQDRLKLQSACFKHLLGNKLYFAPLSRAKPPLRIMDVATGLGDWAIEMGDMFPESIIVGTDLSPIQPDEVPPNVHFYVEDACTVGCWGSFRTQIAQQAIASLEPGGWFESQEIDGNICCDDETLDSNGALAQYFGDLVTASEQMNRPAILAAILKESYEAAGFVDVHQIPLKMPIGGWAKDSRLKSIGLAWQANLFEGLGGFAYQLFNRVFDRSSEETEVCAG